MSIQPIFIEGLYVVFPDTNSLTPTGCPIIPGHSDSNYPELAPDSTGEGFRPTRPPSLQMPAPNGVPQ